MRRWPIQKARPRASTWPIVRLSTWGKRRPTPKTRVVCEAMSVTWPAVALGQRAAEQTTLLDHTRSFGKCLEIADTKANAAR